MTGLPVGKRWRKIKKFEEFAACQKATKLKHFQEDRPKFEDSVGAQGIVSEREEQIRVLQDPLFILIPVHKKINVCLHF